jgi:hypothetical protein
VSSVESVASSIRLKGMGVVQDSGGTPIEVTGTLGEVIGRAFEGHVSPPSDGTNYMFNAASSTRLTTPTVSQKQALANVQACTVTGCSSTSRADLARDGDDR